MYQLRAEGIQEVSPVLQFLLQFRARDALQTALAGLAARQTRDQHVGRRVHPDHQVGRDA